MAVSDYRQGKWTPKKVSKDFDESGCDYDRRNRHGSSTTSFPSTAARSTGASCIKFERLQSRAATATEQAELHGAFEIAGCKGVPELTTVRRLLSTRHSAGVGFSRSVPTPDEHTRVHEVGRTRAGAMNSDTRRSSRPSAERFHPRERLLRLSPTALRFTPVLMQTPGIFSMSPPWHLSYFDKLLLDGQLALGLATSRRAAHSPIGNLAAVLLQRQKAHVLRPALALARAETDRPDRRRRTSDTTTRRSRKASASGRTTSRDRCRPGWTASTSPP